MRFKKIGTRMLIFILPVIMIAMFILTAISGKFSKDIIQKQIGEHMASELNAQNKAIEIYLEDVQTTARNIAYMVQADYKTADLKIYEKMLTSIVESDSTILGSGIWFEPYVFDEKEQYVGPYIYKDGDEVVTTYSYSNDRYDYFSQDYYKKVKESGELLITDPYYDQTAKIMMSTCSMPIFDGEKFIGCITVDISLNAIQYITNNIKVGKQGTGMLLSESGVYLGGVETDKVENSKSILEDENASLVEAGNVILQNSEGLTNYKEGHKVYHLYYDTLEGVNWKLLIKMPQAELNQPVHQLISILLIVCVMAVIGCSLSIIYQVTRISKSITHVKDFAKSLADGDFTIQSLHVETEDEMGEMGNSLNDMYQNNKGVITNISQHATAIDESSDELHDAASHLLKQFDEIKEYMAHINEAMMSASAATEEVNASTEEVNSNVNILANETGKSMDMAQQIRGRAMEVGASSQKSCDVAMKLSCQFEKRLEISIENAKVVESIGNMADIISGIAGQINLLSLNASIEAARAGEQGKGFAVVASEIGKLASDTSEAVLKIQDTIGAVHEAFNGLTKDATEILGFIQETVTPDYSQFVGIADQYGKDAVSIEETSSRISEMSSNIKDIMHEVTQAIQNIAESAQTTADISSQIMSAARSVSGVVDQVSDMSIKQETIASDLNQVVSKFKL